MSSAASTVRRVTRRNKVNAASVHKTRSRRNGRVRSAQQRRPSVRRSTAATTRPHPRFGWYVGVTAMAIIEIIEWPLAIMMMLGHEIAHRAHSRALRDFAEGIEAGA